jgi:hypothetical protein
MKKVFTARNNSASRIESIPIRFRAPAYTNPQTCTKFREVSSSATTRPYE